MTSCLGCLFLLWEAGVGLGVATKTFGVNLSQLCICSHRYHADVHGQC